MKPNPAPPLRRGFKKEAEANSVSIRQKLGISVNDACPARRVADLYGVTVSPAQCLDELLRTILYDEFPDYRTRSEKIACLFGSDWKFSAIVVAIKQHKMVLYNASHSPARQESDIMHELAHIICKHPGDCLQLNAAIGLRHYDLQYEEEAKWLGATLQIPGPGIFSLVKSGLSNQAIADIYGASLDMVVFRRRMLAIDRRLSYTSAYSQR